MKIGYKFRNMRKSMGLTLEEVADKVGSNITTLSMFERDNANISMMTFLELCSFYGVEMLEMLELENGNGLLRSIRSSDDIGSNLLHCRTMRGYSRYKVAELADCNETTISLIEKSILVPTLETFLRLAILYSE